MRLREMRSESLRAGVDASNDVGAAAARRPDAAFIGDDFPDMPLLKIVGLPVAVGNAVPEVRAVCSLRLTRSGGAGAVREFAELLLKARGEWKAVSDAYIAERSAAPSKTHV